MLLGTGHGDEIDDLLVETADRYLSTIAGEIVATVDVESHDAALVHFLRFRLVLGRLERRELAVEAFVHVHGGGDEEEDEQDKGDVGRGTGVELRNAALFLLKQHGAILCDEVCGSSAWRRRGPRR